MGIKSFSLIFVIIVIISLAPWHTHATTPERSTPTWTFMVYLDADNSLSKYAADNLADMMEYGSNANLHIVVLYDSIDNGDSALYLIEKGKKELLKSLGEVDMGSEKTLQFFLNWTAANYPAQHYFLDLWDHGSYYQGVCMDHGDWLTLPELNTALSFFDNKIGHKIDVVGFDACRMGGIEIYYSLSPYVNYAVASEKDEPASGWPYYEVLSGIYGKQPWAAARAAADAMYDWAKKFYANNGLSVTMAAVNLTRFPDFLKEFNEALREALPVVPYYSERLQTALRDSQRYELTSVADLYDLMENIQKIGDYKLNILTNSTIWWISNITYSRAWDCPNPANGVHADAAHGMGIYAPLYVISGDYYHTEFAQASMWPEFLSTILNPPAVNGTGSVNIKMDNGKISVNYTTSGDFVKIYVENASGVNSKILNASGQYAFKVPYGLYTLFVYSYDKNGTVVWAYKKEFDYQETITLHGKFYLNGVILKGAKIRITIENHSFDAVQGDDGFKINLKYPSEVHSNSTILIKVTYGISKWNYQYHLENMRGNTILPIRIYASMLPPFYSVIIVSAFLTALCVAMYRNKNEV